MGMSCPEGYATFSCHKNAESLCLFIRHLPATIYKERSVVFKSTDADFCNPNSSCCDAKVDAESGEYEGFSTVIYGEYACILYMANEHMKVNLEKINLESFCIDESSSTYNEEVLSSKTSDSQECFSQKSSIFQQLQKI